mgnify:CR=1 FL=1
MYAFNWILSHPFLCESFILDLFASSVCKTFCVFCVFYKFYLFLDNIALSNSGFLILDHIKLKTQMISIVMM